MPDLYYAGFNHLSLDYLSHQPAFQGNPPRAGIFDSAVM